MVKLSQRTKDLFKSLKPLEGKLVLQRPDRFTLLLPDPFMAVYGHLQNQLDGDIVIRDSSKFSKISSNTDAFSVKSDRVQLISRMYAAELEYADVCQIEECLEDIKNLETDLERKIVGTWNLDRNVLKKLRGFIKIHGIKSIRFQSDGSSRMIMSGSSPRVLLVHGESNVEDEVLHAVDISITDENYLGGKLDLEISSKFFSNLPVHNYEVVFLEDGVMEFVNLTTGATYCYLREPIRR